MQAGPAQPAREAELQGWPGRFFSDLLSRFDRAASVTGRDSIDALIAGSSVRIDFAGASLRSQMGRAIAHLARPAAPGPRLHIRVWEGTGSGVTLPDLRQELNADGAIPGEAWKIRGERWRMEYRPDRESLSILDHSTGNALSFLPDGGALPMDAYAMPLHLILSWWLTGLGRHPVHAAAVGSRDGAVLLGGPGGTGKSTTAMAAYLHGLDFLADDYVALEPEAGPIAHGLYSSAKLDAASLRLLPEAVPMVSSLTRPEHEKSLLFLHEQDPGRLPASLPIRALVVPRVGAETTTLRPVAGAMALRTLAPSTLFQLPGASRDGHAFSALADLARRLPTYELQVGPDLASVAPVLARLVGA